MTSHFATRLPSIASLSAQPTIASLKDVHQPRPSVIPGPAGLVAAALRKALRPGVELYRKDEVRTPLGGVEVVLQVISGRRRVAITTLDEESASLAMVYGGFHAIYRVSAGDLLMRAPQAAWLLAVAEPELFSWEGLRSLERTIAERVAEPKDHGNAVFADDRRPIYHGRIPPLRMIRMRLNRATDWVKPFERALSGQQSLALSA